MTGTFVQVAFTGRKNTLIVCLADVTFEQHPSACTSYMQATSLTLDGMTLCTLFLYHVVFQGKCSGKGRLEAYCGYRDKCQACGFVNSRCGT